MTDQISMTPFPFSIAPGASTDRVTVRRARSLFIQKASGPLVAMLNDKTRLEVEDGTSLTFGGEVIETIQFFNEGAVAVDLLAVVGSGEIARHIASTVKLQTGSASLGDPQNITVGHAAAVRLLTADPSRALVTISAGDFDLWIGGSAGLVAGGVAGRIPAGAVAEIATRGEVWGRRAPSNSGQVGLLEEFN